jgi:hypothetical protein
MLTTQNLLAVLRKKFSLQAKQYGDLYRGAQTEETKAQLAELRAAMDRTIIAMNAAHAAVYGGANV